MKKIMGFGALICAVFLVGIAFSGVVEAESIQKQSLKSFPQALTNATDWYPGFLIVQLIKGVVAFILVLLILFDLIEPDETM